MQVSEARDDSSQREDSKANEGLPGGSVPELHRTLPPVEPNGLVQMTQSPIYDGFATPPKPYPLGVPIADKIKIHEIDRRTADRMYEAHHEYLPRGRCGWHYGVYLDGSIVGAISFDNWPSQASIRGYESNAIREVSRVCVEHDTPNLASCAMSKAQDTFVNQCKNEVKMLITYVHEDWDGAMFKALRGKGWEYDGESVARHRAPHHEDGEVHEIYTVNKARWVCEL